ncbi:MAG: zinc ribbon domain-containing protein [Chitinophagaceae bacterium]|nr:zinc ribbon domain-containing protein [Chitinophagaceae bacterium]
MIYCSNCGKELPVGSKFCPSCGTTIGAVNREHEPVRTEPVRTEPVRTEPVRTEPVRTEPVRTEPVRTERVVTTQAELGNFSTRRTVNEFYKDPGFWGGLILITGFFLPFLSNNTVSLFDTVRLEMETDKVVLLWAIFPVAGLFMLLHSLNVFSGFLAIFFTFLAVIALVYWGYHMLTNRTKYFGTEDITTIIKTVGIGLWATLLGTILLLFHKRHIKVEVHNTRVIDRGL